MKSASAGYIKAEEADYRRPAEIYHIYIWRDGGQHWYYTSGDVSVVYDGNTYVPALIGRESVEYTADLEIPTLQVKVARNQQPTVEFIAMNPVEILWIEVAKLLRDQAPVEVGVVFVGQIRDVSIKGVQALANCVGLEFFLSQPIPIQVYQPACNNSLYDGRCGLTATDWAETATVVSMSSDSVTLVLSGAGFEAKEDGYYTRGYLELGAYRRMIVDHVQADKAVQIRYRIPVLGVGSTVTVYAGCNLDVEMCRDKFDNMLNFFGQPYIPLENPATRIP